MPVVSTAALLTPDRSPDIDYSEEEEESDSSEQEGSDDPLQVRTAGCTQGCGCGHEALIISINL